MARRLIPYAGAEPVRVGRLPPEQQAKSDDQLLEEVLHSELARINRKIAELERAKVAREAQLTALRAST